MPITPQTDLSRRRFSSGFTTATLGAVGRAVAAAPAAAAVTGAARDSPDANTLTVADGTKLYFKDWGTGQPVVFSHGWPLTSDAFEDQMFFLAAHGYRCARPLGPWPISQPWSGNDMDTYADDLAALVGALDLRDAVHISHSTRGGEVARYIGRHGTGKLAKAVLISSISPALASPAEAASQDAA